MSKEPKLRLYGAASLVVLAVAVIVIGKPSFETKYSRVKINRTVNEQAVVMGADEALAKRQVQIVPAELFKSMNDDTIKLTMIDVRPESEYNLFHLRRALNIPADQLGTKVPELLASSAPNAVYVLMSNDEDVSTKAWKHLVSESIPNVYILEGGVNNWISFFGKEDASIVRANIPAEPEKLQFIFPAALGDRYYCADPSPIENEALKFDARIQLQLKRDKSGGGCG